MTKQVSALRARITESIQQQAMGCMARVQILEDAKYFSSPQHPVRLWDLFSLLSNGYQQLFPQG
jgi:hypothetical protein